ncbi:hypothetical protein [Microbacterium aurum]
MSSESFRAFVDESSAARSVDRQEYLIGAALIPVTACDEVRTQVRTLALPGQIKLHWTDEQDSRRRTIVKRLSEIAPMTVVVTHLSERVKKNERCRRKCLASIHR